MEKLDIDLLSIIAAYLPNKSIDRLSDVSNTLSKNVENINDNLLFWKERTELLIGKQISDEDNVNWKEVYNILLRYIGEKKPYKILPTFKEKDCLDAQRILEKYGHNRNDTHDNIMAAFENKDFKYLRKLLSENTEPTIYNNSAFLEAIRMAAEFNDIVKLLDYGRVDILTIDQNELFNTITKSGSDATAYILQETAEKLNTNKEFNNSTFIEVLEYHKYNFANILLNSNKIDMSTINQKHLIDVLTRYVSSTEQEPLLERILRNFDTNKYFNNRAFLWYIAVAVDDKKIRNKNIDMWLLNSNKVDLSIIDDEELFRGLFAWLSEYDNINMLKKILKTSRIDYDLNKAFTVLSDNTSEQFMKLLLEDPRFDPSSIKQPLSFLAGSGGKLFLADPRVHISLRHLKRSTRTAINAIKEYIKDPLSGLVAMHYLYNVQDGVYISIKTLTNETEEFYYRFLRYLVLKKPSMIDAIKWLITLIKSLDKNTCIIIGKAVNSILNNKVYPNNNDIYFSFKAFFLLAFEPRYKYGEILEKLKTEGASSNALGMSAKILGAKLGLQELIKDGLILTNSLGKQIDDELAKDISNLDY